MTTIRVNGVEIEAEAVAREVQLHPAASLEEARQAAAQALVVRELLLQEAHRLALAPTSADDEDDEAEEDREEDVDDALIRTLLEREVSVSESGEERCRRHYQQNAGSYCTPKLYEASHILFAAPPDDPNGRESARRAALDALAALQKNPRGFTDLAREHSACPSGAEGGGLGQFTADQMVPEFVATFDALEPGTLNPAPVATRFGFHVVRLDHCEPGRPLPFERVRDKISVELYDRDWRQAVHDFIGGLVARARIEGIEMTGG